MSAAASRASAAGRGLCTRSLSNVGVVDDATGWAGVHVVPAVELGVVVTVDEAHRAFVVFTTHGLAPGRWAWRPRWAARRGSGYGVRVSFVEGYCELAEAGGCVDGPYEGFEAFVGHVQAHPKLIDFGFEGG